ncbi:MAG TPA: hypothetical protein VGF99_16110 [Myxococcota bacterium]
MNTIEKRDPGAPAWPTIFVDGEPIATVVGRLAADEDIATLVVTLQPVVETCLTDDDAAHIRATLLPPVGVTSIAPLLMCPDDLDLFCTVVDVEVVVDDTSVIWRRFGVRAGEGHTWWASTPLVFERDAYRRCLAAFA